MGLDPTTLRFVHHFLTEGVLVLRVLSMAVVLVDVLRWWFIFLALDPYESFYFMFSLLAIYILIRQKLNVYLWFVVSI